MNMLKQRRDNFHCGGKDELNLKLTFFIMASFFRNLEVLNPGIKSVKSIWNLKQVWITPKNLSRKKITITLLLHPNMTQLSFFP